jgi:hypothetical protein
MEPTKNQPTLLKGEKMTKAKNDSDDVKKILVFNFTKDSSQVGRGHYEMIAYFIGLNICVPYTMLVKGDSYLERVGTPFILDKTCEGLPGILENWSKKRSDSFHAVQPIIEVAEKFAKYIPHLSGK